MPTVDSNTKYRCNGCGTIVDFEQRIPGPCPNCPTNDWEGLVVQEVCDFCAVNDPTWEYPCADFEMPKPPFEVGIPQQMSRGSWSACDKCRNLIEGNKRRMLAARALRKQPATVRKLLMPVVREMHDRFFANRTGEVLRIERSSDAG